MLDIALRSLVTEIVEPLRTKIEALEAKLGSAGARFVSRREACARLGVSASSLDRWIRGGLIRTRKLKRRVLVDIESLQDSRALAGQTLYSK